MIAILGDLDVVPANTSDEAVILAEAGACLGQITARQVPRLLGHQLEQVVVWLGPADVLAGNDESFVHAEVVAMCDVLSQASPRASVLIVGFPPAAGPAEQVRLFDGATRSVCEPRAMAWEPHPE